MENTIKLYYAKLANMGDLLNDLILRRCFGCNVERCSFLDGEMFLMEIRNNFDGKLITREGKEFPDTGKADGESHGIGLANIKSTCEKYHGTVEWMARDGVFTLSVMLRNTNVFDHEYKFWRS